MAELADAQDLKSWVPQGACGFDPRPRHKEKALHILKERLTLSDADFEALASERGLGDSRQRIGELCSHVFGLPTVDEARLLGSVRVGHAQASPPIVWAHTNAEDDVANLTREMTRDRPREGDSALRTPPGRR